MCVQILNIFTIFSNRFLWWMSFREMVTVYLVVYQSVILKSQFLGLCGSK